LYCSCGAQCRAHARLRSGWGRGRWPGSWHRDCGTLAGAGAGRTRGSGSGVGDGGPAFVGPQRKDGLPEDAGTHLAAMVAAVAEIPAPGRACGATGWGHALGLAALRTVGYGVVCCLAAVQRAAWRTADAVLWTGHAARDGASDMERGEAGPASAAGVGSCGVGLVDLHCRFDHIAGPLDGP